MNWTPHFAERTGQMRRSAVRELLKLTAQPGIISFAGGLPAPELFPIDRVRQATESVLVHQGRLALQYGETEGVAELRDWIAARFSGPNLVVKRTNVMIVSGAQQGLDLIGRVLLDPGDQVVVENPTYLAALSAWRPLGVEFVPVPSDEHGMRVEELEPVLQHRPKLVYTIPNFQNPQGSTLSLGRRVRLAELSHRYQAGLVEDNPYGDLRYSGEPLPDILDLDAKRGSNAVDAGQVIYVGTFSKVLGPGLRVGWIIAPEVVIDKLVQAKQAADLCTSALAQYVTLELVSGGVLEQQISVLRTAYRERRDTMLAALEKHFPAGITWTRPEGGMFLMVSLPGDVGAGAVLQSALQRQVAFVPGNEFFVDGSGQNTMRLNFSRPAPAMIEEGIKRLGQVLAARRR
ncbi:MAG: aminotransferase-like domain-containing protein [Limisphaerales bacterium]